MNILFLKLFFYKIRKTKLITISLLITISYSIISILYFNKIASSETYNRIIFYTYYNIVIQFIIALIINQYFKLEETSNNYNKLLQIPSRRDWLFSTYFSFLIILTINIIVSFSLLTIFGQKHFSGVNLFYDIFFSILFNIIYIPIFTTLAIRFESSTLIAFASVTMVFCIYYGTTSLGSGLRDFIPLLYVFSMMNKTIINHNINTTIWLILVYLTVLIIVLYGTKKWYEKLDG